MTLSKYFKIILALLLIFTLASCGSDNEQDSDQLDNYGKYQHIYESLKNTKWKLSSSKDYKKNKNGKWEIERDYKSKSPSKFLNNIMFFSDEPSPLQVRSLKLIHSALKKEGLWWINDDGSLYMDNNNFFTDKESGLTNIEYAQFTNLFPLYADSYELEDNHLTFINESENGFRHEFKYTKVGSGNSGSGSGEIGDDQPSDDELEIGFYDFSATKSTLKVEYRIYSGNVKSAKIYNGTSSPSRSVSATVNGKMITARISGLKSGTTYYVKCVANGNGGSTTSETTKCITSY